MCFQCSRIGFRYDDLISPLLGVNCVESSQRYLGKESYFIGCPCKCEIHDPGYGHYTGVQPIESLSPPSTLGSPTRCISSSEMVPIYSNKLIELR